MKQLYCHVTSNQPHEIQPKTVYANWYIPLVGSSTFLGCEHNSLGEAVRQRQVDRHGITVEIKLTKDGDFIVRRIEEFGP